MGTRGHVVFDGDDTLWRTQEIYDAIKLQFADLARRRGIRRQDLVQLLDRIDADAAQTRGFTADRFIDSMVEAYRLAAVEANERVPDSLPDDIRRLARPLLEWGDYQLYPDTLEVLERLGSHFDLVLATKGERAVQEEKVRRLDLARFFSAMYFLDRKTESDFFAILASRQVRPDEAWSVGNSVRSDIVPALRAGMHAIWIKRPTWLYEEAPLQSPDATTVNSLTEAANVLLTNDHGAVQRRQAR